MTASDEVQHVTPSPSDLSTVLSNVECTYFGCGRKFRNSAARKFHLEKVHKVVSESEKASVALSPVWYHCPTQLCPYHVDASAASAKHFTTKGRLKQHWLKMHAARVLECDGCSQSFSCQRLLSAHRRSCGLDLRCSLCCSSFGSIEALQSHCRRLGHSPHEQSLVLIRERLAQLARDRMKSTSSTAIKAEQSLSDTKYAKASEGELQSISLTCHSPIVEDCMSSTEDPLNSLSIIMVNEDEQKPSNAQLAFPDAINQQPCRRPSSLFPLGRTFQKCLRSGWHTGEKDSRADSNESCFCPRAKDVTRCSKSIISLRSRFGETESTRHRSLRVADSATLSVPVSIRSPGMSNQPHLLAAIALSELAASAIKRFPGVNAATQTDNGRVWMNNKSARRSCGPPAKRRVLRSRQSTQTQTRLTTKSSRCKWKGHCSHAGTRKKLLKRTLDFSPTHSLESDTKKTAKISSSTLGSKGQKLVSLPDEVNKDSASMLLFDSENISCNSGRKKVKSEYVNSDHRSNYFVIDSVASQKSIALGVQLPEVGLFSSESRNSCSTQTSPRAHVNVGMVTGSSFSDNITLTFMDESSSNEEQSASQQGSLGSQFTNKALRKSKSIQSGTGLSHQMSSVLGVNELADATHGEEGEVATESGSVLLQDAVQNDSTHLTPEVFKYSGEYLLGEKEEVLLEDHNLGDINYGALIKQTCRVDGSAEASRQLSSVQLSNIETQTEHDILLGLSTSPSNQYQDSSEHEFEKFRDDDTSAWCSIETQTCEDFSTIEQYLCSTTQTQTSDQVRRELFPELSISHSQTQTGIDDHPSLVHSHTQTYFEC